MDTSVHLLSHEVKFMGRAMRACIVVLDSMHSSPVSPSKESNTHVQNAAHDWLPSWTLCINMMVHWRPSLFFREYAFSETCSISNADQYPSIQYSHFFVYSWMPAVTFALVECQKVNKQACSASGRPSCPTISYNKRARDV